MEVGIVKATDIREEMQTAYLDYAMSVITARALPDVRDGLKPVQRRILYQMQEMGLRANAAHRKCARIVGDVLGRFHPHGDQSVYEALVRLAQDFTMRYPLVDGQGNFGSIDGDPPAAMRYCVVGDTLVVTDQGLVPIARLSPDGSEDVNVRVLSRGGVVNTASKWWDCGTFPTRRIETQRGYQLTGTLNHPLLVAVRNEFDNRIKLTWKLIGTIEPGDYVVLDRSQVLWPHQSLDLAPFYPKPAETSRTEWHELPAQLDQDLAFLMGALVAEGTFRPTVYEFTNTHGDLADVFRQTFERVFPTCRLHVFTREPQSYGKKPWLQMQIVSQQVIAFLKNLGLCGRSTERLVPEVILRSPKEIAAAFLRGLYEGDGAVERSGQSLIRISLCARSNALLRQVQTLLLRFGIVSTLNHDKTRNMYRLLILGHENLELFQDAIGFVSTANREALAEAVTSYSGRVLSQSDYVPFLAEFVRTHAHRGQREWLGKHNFDGTERLPAMLPRLQKALSEEDYTFVHTLAESRYLFERVTSVQDAGEQRVYSLRVDSDCHSFVANGFINHNTEARLTELAEELLRDIDQDTVDFKPNFDDTLQEPAVLPGKVPNLLINGANGIAVGMATLIPPHNLGEICDAIHYLIEHWNKIDEIEPDDLMQFVQGPDFPTGGIILGVDGIKEAYATGKGRIVVRGKLHTEAISGGRTRIVVTEIPYQVNKSALIERIAELVRDKRIEEIGDLRDESDRQGMSIVIELKRGAEATPVINALLKYTALQTAFSVNMLALVDGEPRVLSLKRALQLFVQHRQQVITRRTQFELERAKLRAHILEGLKIALDFLDEVIRLIRQSPDADTARDRLIKRFKLSELQATAILDMQLRRLAALERKKIEEELAEVRKRIKYLEDLLAHPKKILGVIQQECADLKERFGDARRTFIAQTAEMEFKEGSQVVGAEVGPTLVTLSRDGILRRASVSQYRRTRSDAVKGVAQREDDPTIAALIADMADHLVLFTNHGRALPWHLAQVPDVARNPNGVSLANQLESGEKFVTLVAFNDQMTNAFMTLATVGGKIKRTPLEEFATIPAGGTRAINLAEGDELGWVRITRGGGEFLIVTARGQALRFKEDDVPVQGRIAGGVWAIKLAEGDRVVALDCVARDGWLVVASANGFAKRVALKEFPCKGRYTGGVTVFTPDNQTGELAAACILDLAEDVTFVASSGLTVRVRAENLVKANRSAKGRLFVTLKEGDSIARLVRLVGKPEGAEEEKPSASKSMPPEKGVARALPPRATRGNGHSKTNGEASQATSEEKFSAAKDRKEKGQAPSETAAPPDSSKLDHVPKERRGETEKERKGEKARAAEKPADEAEQIELPFSSFKPLPKKKR